MDDPIKNPKPGYVYQNIKSGNIFMVFEDGSKQKGLWIECKNSQMDVARFPVKELMFGKNGNDNNKVRFICDMNEIMAVVRSHLPKGTEEE